ncbi:Cathepsin L [Araneus ventricosus]|uniref:Cathepsin L n=1 Tax=Araneus ventricosus TaxID=182803 RepID=A0A4Y2AB83_ARAVE|nr:Cathepsin L [Araneus ventricosus]
MLFVCTFQIIEEFVYIVNGLIPKETEAPIPFVVPKDAVVPDSVDWRNESAVTPVKNQGSCGSCYAFSATGALEGQHKLKRGKLVSLSEQNIIDCSMRQGNDGCGGGSMDSAFQYVMVNGGLDSEKSYPYKGKVGRCSYKRKYSATNCLGYSDIIPRDEDTLKIAVAIVGPISVGIDASHDSFQLYKGGIYDEPLCSSTNLDHGVLAVGYGTQDGQDYWLVKNSWGSTWGEDGYIKMSRNKNNQCGIATFGAFSGTGAGSSHWEQDRDNSRGGQTPRSGNAAAVLVCVVPREGERGRGAVFQRLPSVPTPKKVPGKGADDVQTNGYHRLASLYIGGSLRHQCTEIGLTVHKCFNSGGSYVER